MLFMHHLVSILLFTGFVTDTQSDHGFSFVVDSTHEHPNSWLAVFRIGTIMGMFASSSFLTDMIMLCYHLMKESHPLRVYRLLQVGTVWAVLAKFIVHTLFFVQIARDANLLPASLVGLWIAVATFLMCTEYYFAYVFWRISKNHYYKRVHAGEICLKETTESQETPEILSIV